MADAGDRDDEAQKREKDKEHDRRNRNQLELLRLAYERKRHRDYIDEMRRRTNTPPREARGGEGTGGDPFD
jgi:hypothetical protein